MNVHCIDTKSLKAREHETGQVLEKHAKQSEHKYLLEDAIGCLNINTDQNKGDVEGMENGLNAIVEHIYRDHAHCSGFLKDGEKYKHSNLSHGKDFTSDSLRTDLAKIFLGNESVNPRKLASLSSSQANENFNNMTAAKAAKAKQYSSSASFGYRVDSSILQKNEGYAYVSEVHNVHVNPSKIYDQIIGLKPEVTDKESQEIPEIQDTTKIPLNEQEVIKAPVSRNSDIIQLAAYSETVNFSTYIFPSQAISKEASEVKHIFVNGNQMFHNSTAVQYKLAHEALTDFIIFLSSFPRTCILEGHNIKRFDTHVLYNQLHIHNMWNEFCLHVCAFCDTLN
ncbi:unnamed protein product [Mytilus coruscus]|uniref:Uncharacterized protein n=1 Tax=Mytilus coruscus TaxID=42192 RepID=A0A6J8BKC9_MYTCO|nr:unnamed protein product [Mytilus coruscus]